MATLNQRRPQAALGGGDSLADILERVLDTGIVIAGDIKVQLADIELLTIQIRLVVCSVDRAQEMGMTWWQQAPFIAPSAEASTTPAVEAEREAASAGESLPEDEEEASIQARLSRLEAMHEQLLYRLSEDGSPGGG